MKNCLAGWLMLVFPVLASGQVSFEAFTDARQVVLSRYFDVTFLLRNADGEDFRPPSFDNFSVLAGPSRSLSTTIVNGQVSKEMGYTYTLQPRRKGKFTIGSASIRANGKIFKTNPLTVEVIGNKDSSKKDAANQVFVQAELNTNKAFVGQQITLDYKLYTAVNIDSYSILEESDYQGFYAEDLRRFDDPPVREVIKGVQYVTKILKRVALFPQQAGLLKITPLKLEMAVFKEDPRSEGFLFNRQVQRIFLDANEAQLAVSALPSDPPASFSGAVGNYTANFTINRSDISTDDALTIRLSLSGNGDLKRVQIPTLELPDSFEVYNPKVIEEDFSENFSGELVGKKEIEYIILPKKTGKYLLQPAFSYFDPVARRYVSIDTYKFEVTVQQGTPQKTENAVAENKPQPSTDIRFIKTDTHLSQASDVFLGSAGFWILTVLPILLFGGIVLLKRDQIKRSSIDPTQIRSQRARQEALKRLKTAEHHLKTNNSSVFYDEISRALLGYVCDKLQIPRSALSKNNVQERLQSLKVEESLTNDFMQIIQTSEVALYSGKDSTTDMNDIYQRAIRNLSKIETFLGKK